MASTSADRSDVIPHHYIVVFKQDTPHETCHSHCARARELHSEHVSALSADEGAKYDGVKHEYKFASGWSGYAGSFHDDVIRQLGEADEVEYFEPDCKVYASKIIKDTEAKSWGLARISHKEKLAENTKTTCIYDSSAGEGARAYIIDTGILAEHEDFEGRATFGYNAAAGSTDTDKNGHGTHVAGTIGGKTYGVAKKTTLIGVKVLGDDGTGSNSSVLAGLQWAVEDAEAAGAINKSAANMSLGGGYSKAVNNGVAAAVRAGLTVCVAAGNESRDASTSSPASEPTAITVGSITINDTVSPFSNYGKLVDVFAPGSNITSAWIDETGGGSTSTTNTISGTSMATPHVTGLSVYLIALEGLSGSKAVSQRLKELARSAITPEGLKGSPNRLAFNGNPEA